jgi:hypothetical protein
MEMSGQLHAPAALLPEKSPLVPTGQEAGPQSRCGRCGEEKNLSPLPGIEPRPSSPQLSRLRYFIQETEVKLNCINITKITFKTHREHNVPIKDQPVNYI